MKKEILKTISGLLLIITLLFAFPAALQTYEVITPFEASALLSADDPGLTKETVEQEMYERYREIFDFVSSNSIITANQSIPFTEGDQSADSNINILAAELTANCSTDYDKANTLYNWIVKNIYHDNDYDKDNYSAYLTASDVFKHKYTVSEGFANLYTAMCRCVGVPCRKVVGYAVSGTESDEEYFAEYFKNKPNHAWNEIYINGEWVVVDAAWDCANIYENGSFSKKNSIIKWFGMDFEEFANSHVGMSYDEIFQSDKFTFTVENNKIIASNYVGTARKVIVPKGVDVVTELSKTKTDFTSVVLPATLTEISNDAFKNCVGLISVTVPEGVTTIGSEAFSGCSSLTTVNLPSTLVKLDSKCFFKCSALKNITIPDGVKIIPSFAFNGCTSLVTVNIPSSVKQIDSSAFKACTSIKTITIPETVTSLGNSVFQDCTALESAVLNCKISSISGSAFSKCTSLTTVHISDSVTEISSNAFKECTSLKTITGAENIRVLRNQAFLGCTVLENCDFFNELTHLERHVFKDCQKITSVTIPFTYSNIGAYDFNNCFSLEKVVIEGNVTSIDEGAFYNCISLKDVVIPESVTTIGNFAFSDCTALAEIDLPDNLTEISNSAFSGCVMLKSIGGDIPSSVTSIGEYAFYDCDLQGEFTIPDSITVIPKAAFYQCTGITKLNIPVSVKTVGEFACANLDKLTDIYYAGTKAQWSNVVIEDHNTAFLNAELHCIDDHQHSYNSTVTSKATCASAGELTYTCTCGDTYSEVIPALAHTETAIPAVDATCTKTGLTSGVKCSACGEIIVAQTETSSLGHSESGWITDAPATCSKEGTKHTECTVCGETIKTDVITKLAHTETAIPAVGATCTETGFTSGVKCSACGEVIKAQTETPSLGHSEGSWITDTPATCSKEGARHTECTVCGETIKTDVITKLAHTETAIPAVGATCTEAGLTSGVKCSVCGEVIVAQTVTPSLGHSEGGWITDTPATCSKEGTKHTECTVCGDTVKTDVITKLAHTEVSVPAVDATCTKTGLTSGVKCSVCGDVIAAQTATPSLGHSESGWMTDTYATCSEEGAKHTECTVCGDTIKTDVITKLAHTEVSVPAVDATCTKTGLTSGVKCSACGEIIVAQTETSSLSHSEGGWLTDTPATCSKEGAKHTECTVCGIVVRSSAISKNSHKDSNKDNICDMCSVTIDPAESCSHICHKGGISGFFWSVIRLFSKMFGTNKMCDCGIAHY